MNRAVCLLILRADGKILAVSRKNEHTKFGLPGGKVDPGETDEEALRREAFEETGLTLLSFKPVFRRYCEGEVSYDCVTYYSAEYSGELHTDEPITIAWVEPEVLIAGPFGVYNKNLFKALGITYVEKD